jgi:predicted HAD superfamily Cof-like phosphohydrolase
MSYAHPFEQVKEFHRVYNVPMLAEPALPSAQRRSLRMSLLREEFTEYEEAEAQNDLVEIADALGDIVYIVMGTALEYGLPLDEIFNEIHRSNLSKLCPETGKPLYREDGKVMKSSAFTPPDIETILAKHQALPPKHKE